MDGWVWDLGVDGPVVGKGVWWCGGGGFGGGPVFAVSEANCSTCLREKLLLRF